MRARWELGVLVVLLGGRAYAQEAETRREAPPPAEEPQRAVGGHVFIVSPLAPAPLATTSFSMRTVVGLAEGEGPLLDRTAGVDIGTTDYDLAALAEELELQIAPLPWLAVRAGIGIAIFGGLETRSALALGASIRYDPTLGATASFPLGERVRLGVTFDYDWANRANLNVIRPIVESIDQRRVVTRSLVVDDRVSVFVPGASAAFALGRAVGLVASAQYRREEVSEDLPGVSAEDAVTGALALDLDLRPITPVPLGFLLAYRITEPLNEDAIARTHELDFGIYYTGRSELELGIELGLRRFPLLAGLEADAALATLAMRYYW